MNFIFNNSFAAPITFAHDRDSDEVDKISQQLNDLLANSYTKSILTNFQKYTGYLLNLSDVRSSLPYIAGLLYSTLTLGIGNQTLGEEVNLLVPHQNNRAPSRLTRILAVLLNTFGISFVYKVLDKFLLQRFNIEIELKHFLTFLLPLSIMMSHTGRNFVQKTLGLSYHIITPSYKLYPMLLPCVADLIYILVCSYTRLLTDLDEKQSGENDLEAYNIQRTNICCAICLENIPVGQVTATACGHVGCWVCLNRLSVSKNSCPICRDDVLPLLLLRNVSKI